MDGRNARAAVPHGRTHSPHAARRNGKTGQRRGDVELRSYDDDDVQDAAGCRSLVFDLSMTHDRFGSSRHVQQNGLRAKLTATENNTLTIRTFLFSPPLSAQAHACTAIFCVFFSSFSTGPPGDRGALHCRWNVIATQQIGSFRFKRATFYQ